jgi:leucine dehydrogenase
MGVFGHTEFAGHERVVFCHDPDTGLRAIIAVHDRTLGPAAGGCRLFPYPDEAAALTDVLRLSKAMTYKNAIAGLPLGGGKSVILASPGQTTPALLAAFARCVTALGGHYWTAEDVNIGPADAELLADHCPYVFGLTHRGAGSGDPSPFTAGGCFEGMRAALEEVFGSDSFSGRRVALQGVGNVGYELARLIARAGGTLLVADPDAGRTERVAREFGAQVLAPQEIDAAPCDIFAPCALGGTLDERSVLRLRARIVCGVANNQLANPAIGAALRERGIVYAPDYVVNAGGMHNASADIFGRYDVEDVWRRIRTIRDITGRILRQAAHERRPTSEVADALAEATVAAGRARTARPG